MKTIILTDEQHAFLKHITEQMEQQGNRATQYPLFYIYEKEDVKDDDNAMRWAYFPTNGDWEETEEYIVAEGDEEEVYALDIDRDIWVLQSVGGKEILPDTYETDIAGDDFIYRDGVHLHRMGLKEINKPVVNVGPFFTEKAAQAHIDANDYHYNKPFIYVNSAWRNPEMQTVMNILFKLAGKETPSWYA